MTDRWYEKAVIYCLDIDTYADSNGDGVGDIRGLIGRLDYLARLGVTTIWLNPIHPTPDRDDGYDVADFYNVDPRFGTLGDFAELLHQAESLGLKVIIDLVVNHTSDKHPWFQSARSSPDSPYRDWFVWSETAPSDRHQGMVFPGEQATTWTFDRTAKLWYYHRFYKFQPDLNITNPEVRAEIKKICAFWLQLGVSGFRMDAVPFIIEETVPGQPNASKDMEFLTELRQHVQWRKADAVLLAEANVEADQLPKFFGDAGGSSNRIHMLFDFMLNGRLMLALARENPEGIIDALQDTPKLPVGGQWATFLRNHDEVDLSRLTTEQRNDVYAKFGPDENMRLYDRGIRRRLAPMLGNDRRHVELAYSLQFSLRGTPVLRYGEEIGMGEDLEADGRMAVRTPMQWSASRNGGFSTAPPSRLVQRVVPGACAPEHVNVVSQMHDPDSLWSFMRKLISIRRTCPELGWGTWAVVDQPSAQVLVQRCQLDGSAVVTVHNLGADPVTVDVPIDPRDEGLEAVDLMAEEVVTGGATTRVALEGYGFRWLRVRPAGDLAIP